MEYETYKSQGYYSPLRVLTENETEHFRKKVEGIRDRQDADGKKYLGANVHYLFPDLYDLVGKAEILDQVEKVLGPDILCWNAAFFNKEARDPNYVSWHQDLTYWGLEPPAIVTAWIALTPSTTENGCMRVVPGSHADGQIDHADFHGDNNLLSRGQEIQVEVKDEDAVDIILQPGEMSLHDVLIIHGSEANPSDIPRYGFVVRYIPTSCKQIGGRTDAMLVRGEDRFNHFDPVPRPQSDLHPDALAFHEQANERLNNILFATDEDSSAA